MRTILLCALVASSLQANSIYNVTVGTAGLSGTSGYLVFDFLSGGGPELNAVSIQSFSSNGTLGPNPFSTTGTVLLAPAPLGPLPSTMILLDDPVSSAFNEYQAGFKFGSTISFVVNATVNAPGAGSAPDEFSFFLLGSDDSTSLVNTSDPTFADAVLTLDIDGSAPGVPAVYSVSAPSGVSATMTLQTGTPTPTPTPPTSTTPEPAGWTMLAVSCLILAVSRTRWCLRPGCCATCGARGKGSAEGAGILGKVAHRSGVKNNVNMRE